VAEPTRLTAAPRQPNAWELGTLRWDVFYAIVFAAILLLVEADQLSAPSRIAATIALAAMVPWYVAVGRPAMRSAELSWKGPAYLAVLIAAFAVAQSQDTNAWSLAFAICPQCFYLLPFRRAMVPVVVLNVLGAVLLVYRQPHLAGAVAALGIAAFGIGLSYAYGGFVDRIIDQSNERAELIAQLEATRAELAAANRESGTLAFAPADLASETLPGALRRVTERAGAETGIGVSFDVSGTPRSLTAAFDVTLLRVGQEALANVRKHAAAGSVQVVLSYRPASVSLEVTDDGQGFDPAQVNGGYGLRGMRERLGQAGGRVELRTAPGEGTCVRAEVPA
jgi:signal transduction histidine kinase